MRLIAEHGARTASFEVRRIGLFESFVRGQPRPQSDIDLLVEFASFRTAMADSRKFGAGL